MSQSQTIYNSPPKLINAFIAGFNTVASHAYLILLPVAFDLLLWFGPRIRLQSLLSPIIDQTTRYLVEVNSIDLANRMKAISQVYSEVLQRFNLISLIRTYPIGVPSLLASQSPTDSPFGLGQVIEIKSIAAACLCMGLILVVGFLLGCLYFNLLGRTTSDSKAAFDFEKFLTQIGQTLLLTVGLIAFLVLLSLPGLLLMSVFAVINPGLADIAMIVIFFIVLWLMVPMIFTPHSIYSGQRNLFVSIATSVRLVRFFLPGTGIFLLFAILISQGLDILWRVPPASSWLTIVGIFGHAFIYTGLFAASFIYFRAGMGWMIHNIQKQAPREIKI